MYLHIANSIQKMSIFLGVLFVLQRRQTKHKDVMLTQTTIQEADLTPFPPASLLGSPCWSAPQLPHSTPEQTNPRVRGCGGRGVCVRTSSGLVSSVQRPQSAPHREDAIRDVKSFFFFPPSFLLSFPGLYECVCLHEHV